MQNLLCHCVELVHHYPFSVIFSYHCCLCGSPTALSISLSPACLSSSTSIDVNTNPEEQSSAASTRLGSGVDRELQSCEAYLIIRSSCCSRHPVFHKISLSMISRRSSLTQRRKPVGSTNPDPLDPQILQLAMLHWRRPSTILCQVHPNLLPPLLPQRPKLLLHRLLHLVG